MNNKEFNFKRMNARISGGEHKIIFKTPDGEVYEDCEITVESDEQYHHICVVNLTRTIKPKFKVGDVVTNASGLYPDVKYTINAVNYNEQYYCYKEVSGVTYFKDQDKLMLADNIKPKFKAGDRVKNVSLDYPDKIFVINIVNTSNQCYHYFNSNGIITNFKDQDKLILVNGDEVPPPVEDEDKSDILAKSYADVVKYNTLKYNTEHYPAIVNMMDTITRTSNEGKTSCSFIFVDKMAADDSGVYYEEDEICNVVRWHFDKLGYKIKERVSDVDNYVEFIISW